MTPPLNILHCLSFDLGSKWPRDKVYCKLQKKHGTSMKYISMLFFITLNFICHAKVFDVRCQSSDFGDVSYRGKSYENAFLMTTSCEKVSALFGAEDKAKEQCSKWASFYGLKNFEAYTYERSENDFTSCHYESRVLHEEFKKKFLNKIIDIESEYKESGSIFGYTSLYVDNHEKPFAIYNSRNGKESAQWLLINGEYYCGKIDDDIAFFYNDEKKEMRAIIPSSLEEAVYSNSLNGEVLKLENESHQIKAPFLEWKLAMNEMSFLDFYEIKNGQRKVIRHVEMIYFPNNLLCR